LNGLDVVRICALSLYGPLAASTRQRFVQYLPHLAHAGIALEVIPLLGDEYVRTIGSGRRTDFKHLISTYAKRIHMLLTRRDFDLLWVHIELFPYLPFIFERLAFVPKVPVVVDMDDAFFHRYDAHSNRFVRSVLGTKFASLFSRVAGCTAGNAYLKDYMSRYCDNTIILPTVVDTDVYKPAENPPRNDGRHVIGWLGSPTTWQNVTPVVPVILKCDADFHVIGANGGAEIEPGITSIAWTETGEVPELQKMDIGIMPLIDLPFQRGKCGYKLIQYMACGIPVVASPVGVNSDIVSHGENGFLASSDAEWTEALSTLLADKVLQNEMAQKGRLIAEERYSLRSQQNRLANFLTSIVAAHASNR
jgi:glycosyltransferase involved in cell wall biosynthesis